MTALNIIEGTLPLISGSTVSREDNYDTLLSYLNFAKGKLARDTKMWIGGQEIVMTTENVYTLNKIPLLITEIYDENLQIRPKNKFNKLGYTKISPNQIYVNTPLEGSKLFVNWYEEPDNFLIDDEVFIPSDLIEAMQHYIAFKVFAVYKSEEEELKTKIHLEKYKMLVGEYIEATDTQDIDSINGNDLIFDKGLI